MSDASLRDRDAVVRRLWADSAEAYADLALQLPTYQISNRRLVEAVGLRAGDRVVDLACGGGATLAAAFDVEPRIAAAWAVDWVDGMIAEARRRLAGRPVTFVVASAQAFADRVGAEPVDCVLSNGAFFHFERPELVLAEVGRVLKADGVLGFTVPAPSNGGAFFDLFRRAGLIGPAPAAGAPRLGPGPGLGPRLGPGARSRRIGADNVERLLGECGWRIETLERIVAPTSHEDYIRWMTLPVFRHPDWAGLPQDDLAARLRDTLRGTDLQPEVGWVIVVARRAATEPISTDAARR